MPRPTVIAVDIPEDDIPVAIKIPPHRRPHDYCFLAWLGCLCCWPMGMVAIGQACRVHYRYEKHDIDGAYRSSERARMWALRAIVVGTSLVFTTIIVYVATSNN